VYSTRTSRDGGAAWLDGYVPKPSIRLRLFCFPYAGGNASSFRKWGSGLPGFVELCPVQLPGRGRRLHETLFRDVIECVKAAARGLLPYLYDPFALFGHSMGAIMAFEFANHVAREYGLMPRELVVSGRESPETACRDVVSYNAPDSELLTTLRQLNGMP